MWCHLVDATLDNLPCFVYTDHSGTLPRQALPQPPFVLPHPKITTLVSYKLPNTSTFQSEGIPHSKETNKVAAALYRLPHDIYSAGLTLQASHSPS